MKIISNRFSFATIGIISGHPRYDKYTARIIDVLKEESKEPLDFVGVIGDEYSNKLTQTYASSSVLAHDEIVINRNYVELFQQSALIPYRAITHYKNGQLRKSLKLQGFYDDLYDKRVPAVITVGNFSLMRRLYIDLNESYKSKNAIKPLRIGFDEMIAYRNVGNEDYLDFIYYNLPRTPENLTKYIFPSMCIGYEGLFRAFQFLQKQKSTEKDSFLIKEFTVEVGELVKIARGNYRKSHGFSEDQYLTFFAPGNNQKQVKFSFKSFGDSLKVFTQQSEIKNVDKGFFKILISVPEDKKIADLIKSKAAGLASKFEISFVEEKDKYGAMCASDFAVLHNGEVTVEAAACQLPALVINSMSNFHAYLSYLYNGHESPLNVSTNYEGYQELLGSLTAIGNKISHLMLDHFKRPKLRYHYVKLYRQQIQRMLAMNGKNPQLSVSRTGLQIAAGDILKKISLREGLEDGAPLNKFDRKQKLQLY